jgi:uncharacterized protein (TIGR03437 family)
MGIRKLRVGRASPVTRRRARTWSVLLVPLVLCAANCLLRAQSLTVWTVPVGVAPLGIDVTTNSVTGSYAVVANSGDNSVSVLQISRSVTAGAFVVSVTPVAVVKPIASPYAVAACVHSGDYAVVTSPNDNSVSIIQIPQGQILATLKVGSHPMSVGCGFGPSGTLAVVSNYGDNTLSVINVSTSTVIATITGVPGSGAFHGIGITPAGDPQATQAWIGGTNANALTVFSLETLQVLTQVPVNAPSAVEGLLSGAVCCMIIASETDGTVTFFNPSTMQPELPVAVAGLTKPVDVVFSMLGIFAIPAGSNNSVVGTTTPPTTTSNLSIAVPSPAALSTYAFGSLAGNSPVLLITSTSSNTVYVATQAPPTPAQFSIADGASFGNSPGGLAIAPGSLASLFAATGASQPTFVTSLPLPTSLGGVSLSVGGTLQLSSDAWTYSTAGASLAPLLYVGPTQINFQLPPGIAPGSSIAAQLTKADGSTLLATLQVAPTYPGIFTILQNGGGQAAVLNQDNSHNGNPATSVGATPAARGSVIQIFATGAGATNPALAAGQPAPASGSLVLTVAQPTVTIGGVNAPVQFSGLAPGFVGLWQINAVVPAGVTPGMTVPMSISAGGQTSNSVTIAVQ